MIKYVIFEGVQICSICRFWLVFMFNLSQKYTFFWICYCFFVFYVVYLRQQTPEGDLRGLFGIHFFGLDKSRLWLLGKQKKTTTDKATSEGLLVLLLLVK